MALWGWASPLGRQVGRAIAAASQTPTPPSLYGIIAQQTEVMLPFASCYTLERVASAPRATAAPTLGHLRPRQEGHRSFATGGGPVGGSPRRRLFDAFPDSGSDDALAATSASADSPAAPPSPPPVPLEPTAALSAPATDHPNVRIWVFWDIDNKHPEGALDTLALVSSLRAALSQYGDVQSVTAVGNHRSFTKLPPSLETSTARQLANQEVRLALDERAEAGKPLKCGLCGKRFGLARKLREHFKQLHMDEFERRERFRKQQKRARSSDEQVRAQRFLAAAKEVEEAVRLATARGYGLLQGLKRAGVEVVAVPVIPEAADDKISRLARSLVTSLSRSGAGGGGKGQGGKSKAKAADAKSAGSEPPEVSEPAASQAEQPPVLEAAEVPVPLDCLCIISDDTDFNALLSWTADRPGWSTLVVCSHAVAGRFKNFPRAADVVLTWEDVVSGQTQRLPPLTLKRPARARARPCPPAPARSSTKGGAKDKKRSPDASAAKSKSGAAAAASAAVPAAVADEAAAATVAVTATAASSS